MTQAQHMTPEQALPLATKRLIFATVMCCAFLAMLDSQIIATALPTIMADLGEMEKYSWISSAYLITHSAIMPICGKLGDLFGRKYVLQASVLVFVLGSLACGLAGSVDALILARLFKGLGAGGIIVTVFAINADLFEPRERARYQSFASLTLLLSAAIGPVLGGWMTEAWGWRSIFLINLPFGALAMILLQTIMPYRRPDRQPKIDYLGAALVMGLVTGLVIWSDSPQLFGGLLTPMALAVLGAFLILAFAFYHTERRVPEPVLSMDIVIHPTISRLLVISIGGGAIALGMSTYHALYLQKTTDLSPAQTGGFFIAMMSGITLGSMSTGRWIAATGRYKEVLVLGLTLSTLLLGGLAVLPTGLPYWQLGLVFFALGMASGLGQQVPTIAAQFHVEKRDVGAATGAISLFRMSGAAVATSIYGTILNLQLGDHFGSQPLGSEAYANAYLWVYGVAACSTLGCALLALSLPKSKM